MSDVVEVGTDAMRRHAGEVEALAGAAYDGVQAGRHLAVSGEAFGRLCGFLGAALAPVQAAGVTGTSLAVGSLGATATQLRATARIIDEVDRLVVRAMPEAPGHGGSW